MSFNYSQYVKYINSIQNNLYPTGSLNIDKYNNVVQGNVQDQDQKTITTQDNKSYYSNNKNISDTEEDTTSYNYKNAFYNNLKTTQTQQDSTNIDNNSNSNSQSYILICLILCIIISLIAGYFIYKNTSNNNNQNTK